MTLPERLTIGSARMGPGPLRRMKAVATAFLVTAAGIYVVTYVGSWPGAGYVRAASEAAMVGGLADWFAITALFRRPLHLPIPHTALIPTRKDALAQSLGSFVTDTFLTRENVGSRLGEADVVRRLARWLVDPANAGRVGAELAGITVSVSEAVDPATAADLLLATARTDAARRSYPPLLGRLLQTTIEDEGHQALTDIALRSTHTWLLASRAELVEQLKAFAEAQSWMLWLFTTRRRIDRLYGDVVVTIGDAAADRTHPVRRLIDRFLLTAATDLQTDDQVVSRVNEEALRVLNDPALREWLIDVVDGLLVTLRETLADPDGVAVQRLTGAVVRYAQQVLDDEALCLQLQRLLERATFYAVDHYADEFTALVVTQVARWDGVETARRIELLAGRDLQFIRINGTVVGALAGLTIYSFSRLLLTR